jgi:hypothetical protein
VKRVRIKVFVVAVISTLVLVGSAVAAGNQKPSTYNGAGGNVQAQVKGTAASNTLGSLPFTGLDLALIVGGGLVLVIAGVSVRRLASRKT